MNEECYFSHLNQYNKVNRCLARYSPHATTTNQPTNRAPNEPARPMWSRKHILGQKRLLLGQTSYFFWGSVSSDTYISENYWSTLFALFHWSGNGPNGSCRPIFGLKWPKNAYFGLNLAVFGPKILIFMRVSKRFGTHVTEEPLRQLVCIVFWSGMGSNGPKMTIFGQKCQFRANFGRFGAKNSFIGGGVILLVPSYQGTNEAPFLCWKHWPVRLQLAARDEFWPEIWIFGAKKSIFFGIAIFVKRAYPQYTGQTVYFWP